MMPKPILTIEPAFPATGPTIVFGAWVVAVVVPAAVVPAAVVPAAVVPATVVAAAVVPAVVPAAVVVAAGVEQAASKLKLITDTTSTEIFLFMIYPSFVYSLLTLQR